MSRHLPLLLLLLLLLGLLGLKVLACEPEQAHQGCKISGETCTCSYGCKSEFRYSNNRECRNALRDRGKNICSRIPCHNKGNCIQISQEPGFKCTCHGTGYYGNRCERECPKNGIGRIIPYECVII